MLAGDCYNLHALLQHRNIVANNIFLSPQPEKVVNGSLSL